MRVSRQCFTSVAFALATFVVGSGILGCGVPGSGSRGSAGVPLAKADAVDVTYYYLPG
jgi:hypothetical protein